MGDNGKKNLDEAEREKKLSSKMDKQLSPFKALFRILVAIAAFIWFLAGGSAQTVLALSGGSIGFAGVVSFFIRNPVTFLIMGLVNVISGIIFLIFDISLIALAIFHFLWSIRWFYGYRMYRNLKKEPS
jgi:hypothetical protein